MSPLWILCLVILAAGALVVGWAARDTADAVVELREACDGLRTVSDELGRARIEADALHERLVTTRDRRSGSPAASEVATPEE